jgi:NHL repeat
MRQASTAFAAIVFLNNLAPAQQYVISTLAGGGPPPTPASTTSMGIPPQGMATDASGKLFFISSNCIFRLDAKGIVTRLAGNSRSGYLGDGGPALAAEFSNPSGVAVDGASNVYIADSGNQRVRKVSATGIVTTVAGTGIAGYSGDGGPAIDAQLDDAAGLAVDAAGNVYADQYTNVIRLLQPFSSSTSVNAIANAASGQSGTISAGEIVVISGSVLGPAKLASGAPGSDRYPTQLAGTTVQFNGAPAPSIYAWTTAGVPDTVPAFRLWIAWLFRNGSA